MSFLRKFGETVRFITGNLTEKERKQELKNITHRDDLSFYEGTAREVEDRKEPNWTSDMVKELFTSKKDENIIKNELKEQWDYDLDCPGCIGNFLFPPGYHND